MKSKKSSVRDNLEIGKSCPETDKLFKNLAQGQTPNFFQMLRSLSEVSSAMTNPGSSVNQCDTDPSACRFCDWFCARTLLGIDFLEPAGSKPPPFYAWLIWGRSLSIQKATWPANDHWKIFLLCRKKNVVFYLTRMSLCVSLKFELCRFKNGVLKMNPEDCIFMIATAIENRPTSLQKTFHLCIFEDRLCCLPDHHTTKKHHVFCKISDFQLKNGFTSKEWYALGSLLMAYIEKHKICLKHQKLSRSQNRTNC